MQYAVKGTDEQWKNVLDGKDVLASGSVSIRSVREKRKSVDDEDIDREANNEKKLLSTSSSKKNKKKKSKR
jgi:hypothetical protein